MKLVREHITHFEKRANPYDRIGVGKSTRIRNWLEEMNMQNYTLNDDLTIDIDILFLRRDITELPDFINFNNANSVYIRYQNFESLRGMPKKVIKDFDCSGNKLRSLEGAPRWVGGDFRCYENPGRFKKEDVKAVCDVKGKIEVLSYKQKAKQKYNKNYRKRGPLSQRTSHKFTGEYGPTFSYGYKLYYVLKYIKESEPEGLRYTDIIGFAYDFSYGKGSFNSKFNKGYWGDAMSVNSVGSVGKKITKNQLGRYVLNISGNKYLKKYKDIFEK